MQCKGVHVMINREQLRPHRSSLSDECSADGAMLGKLVAFLVR